MLFITYILNLFSAIYVLIIVFDTENTKDDDPKMQKIIKKREKVKRVL